MTEVVAIAIACAIVLVVVAILSLIAPERSAKRFRPDTDDWRYRHKPNLITALREEQAFRDATPLREMLDE